MRNRPAWLLAVVFIASLGALVLLEALKLPESASRVLGLVVPILTALFIADRLDERSDRQDKKLAEQDNTLATIEKATNGELTQRLDDAISPIRDEIASLRSAIATKDDPPAD